MILTPYIVLYSPLTIDFPYWSSLLEKSIILSILIHSPINLHPGLWNPPSFHLTLQRALFKLSSQESLRGQLKISKGDQSYGRRNGKMV